MQGERWISERSDGGDGLLCHLIGFLSGFVAAIETDAGAVMLRCVFIGVRVVIKEVVDELKRGSQMLCKRCEICQLIVIGACGNSAHADRRPEQIARFVLVDKLNG